MSRPLRIGFARIAQETNGFCGVPTVLEDFHAVGRCLRGPELLAACQPDGHEAPGLARNVELSGFVRAVRKLGRRRVVPIPLVSAWTIPGGPLTAACLAGLRDELLAELTRVGELDGLFIAMHGAMGAQGSEDPEADLLVAVRRQVGPDLPIAVTLDLHAQLSPRFVDATTFVAGYRTNPHRDHARVGYRAGAILVRTLLQELRPTVAWRSLPLVLGGGTTIDFLPTMRPIFRWMRRAERDKRVLYLSQFNAHIWNGSPDLGWSAHVVTDDDPQLANTLADELADRLWAVRHPQPPEFPDAATAIEQARDATLRRRLGTVCMCDASDIVGAGASGENTRLLRALREQADDLLCYAPVRDAEALARIWELEPGATFDGTVGGRLEPELNEPLDVCGTVLAHLDHGTLGRMAALDLGQLKLVVTEGPPLAMQPSFYAGLGLNPWKADVVVVKSLFPFRLYFLAHNRKTIYVKTRGSTDFDAPLRTRYRLPVHPVDEVADWRPADRIRRGIDPTSPADD
jgi:microcystin degradation protein MlrC